MFDMTELKALCEESGIENIASRSGMTKNRLSSVLNGKPLRISEIQNLVIALGIKAEDIERVFFKKIA